jgi:TRAP-type C4-dicarboxylate transport system substrate-binding protein
MGRKKLLALISSLFLILVLALPLASCSKAEPTSTPITLKMVTFLPNVVPDVHFAQVFCDRVNERSNGKLRIELFGPEVIAEHEQPEALRTGVVDFMIITAGMYRDLVPGAMGIKLSKMNLVEERDSGFDKLMDEFHRKANMVYLGRVSGNLPMLLITNKQINKPADLRGLKMASSAAFNNFMLAWGISPVDTADHYVAMERGVTDGNGGTLSLFTGQSLFEVAKYWIDHGFADSDLSLTMNQDSWNKLPKNLQDLISEIMVELDTEVWDWFGKESEGFRQVMLENGCTPIYFSSEDAAWYVSVGRQAEIAAIQEKLDPADFTKLTKFIKE